MVLITDQGANSVMLGSATLVVERVKLDRAVRDCLLEGVRASVEFHDIA